MWLGPHSPYSPCHQPFMLTTVFARAASLLFSDRMERDRAHTNPLHLPLSIDNNFILQKYRIWASPLTRPGMCWHPTSHSLDVQPSSPPLLRSALLSSITGTPEAPLLVFLPMCSPWCHQFLQNKYNHTHTHNTHTHMYHNIHMHTHMYTYYTQTRMHAHIHIHTVGTPSTNSL